MNRWLHRASIVPRAVWRVIKFLRPHRTPPPDDPLDQLLFRWSPRDGFTRRDLLRSVAVLGASGSGKTSGSGRHLSKSLVLDRRVGGLIIASKPGDRAMWQEIFAGAGRAGELVVFGPGGDHRFNLLDFQARSGADSREITQCITVVGETLNRSDGDGGGDRDPYWAQQSRRTIHNAVEVVLGATGKVTAWDLQTFINTAALTPASLSDPAWQSGFHGECMKKAHDRPKSVIEQHDFDLAAQFWFGEWPAMNDRTRSSILAGVMGLLHVFNTGIVHELIGGETTITPAVFDEGKWVLVDMPVANYGAAGSFVSGAWQYATQRHILRRDAAPGSPLTCIWIDEYQNHVTSFDAKFLAECRSHHGCMVALTQSLHSFFIAVSGKQGEHAIEALLTNFGTKVFHALGDDKSAQYAASLIGKEIQVMVNTSMAPVEDLWLSMVGGGKVTSSTNTSWLPVLQNNAFMKGLRTGGRANGFLTDAIVVRNGELFADGRNWMKVAFSQNG